MKRLICFGGAVVVAALGAAGRAGTQPSTPEARNWWRHVRFLASDKLEGRNAGSLGHKLAAEYVAGQFKRAGLEPCGDGPSGYLQRVPLVSKRLSEPDSSLSVVGRNGRLRELKLGDDAILSMRVELPEAVAAPAVFLGYALAIPAEGGRPGYDDFAGRDVRGKLLVAISGSPSHLPGALRAHFSSSGERAKALAAGGALGLLLITNPKTADIPWSRASAARLLPSMSLDDAALREGGGPSLSASLNAANVSSMFDGAPESLPRLLELATAGKPLPRFPLNITIRARTKVEKVRLESQNVCGILPGGEKRAESVVLSAHLDHLGSDLSAPGLDKIYNGAMDNASGIATLIETARQLHARLTRPSRSIVFVAVTAEEKGLLGSRYFANRIPPTVGAPVANVNFDMFLPIHAMRQVMAFGLDESSLKTQLAEVAEKLGLGLQGDLEPHRNRFIRSDQYSFIQRGVPALALKVGYTEGSPEAALQKDWTASRYHALADDLSQPVNFEAATMFNRVALELALAIANVRDRPAWNESSFFRRFAVRVPEAVSGGRD